MKPNQRRRKRGRGGSPPGEVGGAQHLNSGLVNFILPCSVAIFRAIGTASSHLERTHSRSHLSGQQPVSGEPFGGRGGRARGRGPHLKRISAFMLALRS